MVDALAECTQKGKFFALRTKGEEVMRTVCARYPGLDEQLGMLQEVFRGS